MSVHNLYSLIGGLDQKHLCPVDYRTELREAKARVDLPFYRAVLDEFSFSLDLLLHAIESQLRESGMLLINSFQILGIVNYTAKCDTFVRSAVCSRSQIKRLI